MKVTVDENLCTSCGLCVETCPEVFQLNDEDIAEVKVNPVPPEVEDSCREAVDGCPVDAISIQEE